MLAFDVCGALKQLGVQANGGERVADLVGESGGHLTPESEPFGLRPAVTLGGECLVGGLEAACQFSNLVGTFGGQGRQRPVCREQGHGPGELTERLSDTAGDEHAKDSGEDPEGTEGEPSVRALKHSSDGLGGARKKDGGWRAIDRVKWDADDAQALKRAGLSVGIERKGKFGRWLACTLRTALEPH